MKLFCSMRMRSIALALSIVGAWCNGQEVLQPISNDQRASGTPASMKHQKKHKRHKIFKKTASVGAAQEKKDVSIQEPKQPLPPVQKQHYVVRVLLDEQEMAHHAGWALRAQDGFFLTGVNDESKKIDISHNAIHITARNGSVYVNNKKVSHKNFKIIPKSGYTDFTGDVYQGTLYVLTKGTQTYLVNAVEMEDYLVAVVSAESWPGWPLEVNKVMAIACRSYVISMIQQAQSQERLYHIKNTNAHQTYKGFKKDSPHQVAVQQTRGMFLAHNNKPIIAMFDSCCGGVIPARIKGVDFKSAPYLARTYACDHCKRCKLYRWQAKYSLNEFEATLKKGTIPRLKKLKDVAITKKDSAGLVREVSIKGSTSHTVSGKKIYSLFKNKVKSFCFTVNKKAGTLVFEGRGYGHHLGLCQWGAKEMVADGWDYKSILQFYYPGTVMMKLAEK